MKRNYLYILLNNTGVELNHVTYWHVKPGTMKWLNHVTNTRMTMMIGQGNRETHRFYA